MEQQIWDLQKDLRLANERLQQQQLDACSTSGTTTSESGPPGPNGTGNLSMVTPSSARATTERIVYIPNDRKCPVFRGHHGIGITEWIEEAQACMRIR